MFKDRIRNLVVFALILGAASLAGKSAAEAPSRGQKAAAPPSSTPEALALVEQVAARIASYPVPGSWQAKAHATTSRMTSDWKPKSTMTSEKMVTVADGRWSEEILSSIETEDGRTRDVTAEQQKEARERAAKQRRASADERKGEQRSRGRRSLDLSRDELFPFDPGHRSGYDFTVEGPSELDGAAVIVLRSRSRVRSEEKLEGLYFIDPQTSDIRRAELTVAKKPGPLKRMEMDLDFLVLPEGYHMMAKAVMRLHVDILIKNVRVEAVEAYSDFAVRD